MNKTKEDWTTQNQKAWKKKIIKEQRLQLLKSSFELRTQVKNKSQIKKTFMSVAKCEASYVKKNQFLFQTSFDWFLPKQNSPNTRRKVFKTKSTTQKFKVIKNNRQNQQKEIWKDFVFKRESLELNRKLEILRKNWLSISKFNNWAKETQFSNSRLQN